MPYQQDFSDPPWWSGTSSAVGGYWRVVNGQLLAPQVKNNPLWLQARLPADVAVEFDVRSEYPEGDIRVELFGDGTDPGSGYVLVHGGWNNTLSVLARKDMNAPSLKSLQQKAALAAERLKLSSVDLVDTGVFKADTRVRVESNSFPVQAGRTYHWRIERRGTLLRWSIDGQPFLELNDPFPLQGPRARTGWACPASSRRSSSTTCACCRWTPRSPLALLPPPAPRRRRALLGLFDERQTLGDDWSPPTPRR